MKTLAIKNLFFAMKTSSDGKWTEDGVVKRLQFKPVYSEDGLKAYRLVFFCWVFWAASLNQ